jgi:hypothetical protein
MIPTRIASRSDPLFKGRSGNNKPFLVVALIIYAAVAAVPLASWMARHTRSGVVGIST